ncbi:hypothetical protein [Rhodococcus pyridinivorans]|uniref:hypothetical protein n=1 Tax=Rhodococcus pyridinivorans TaxID=103816 RepID=UPI00207888D1|nr:hypothetical protein [Rhodococcus pyridinivorans]USI88761.1 hypothetical protein LLA01_14165 [Rhodococcus pyridinivorans]
MDLNLAQTQSVLIAVRRLGIDIPEPIATVEARVKAIAKAAESVAPAHHDMLAAIIRAVDAGKNPVDDKDVQRMLAGQSLANDAILHGLRGEAAQLLTEALIEHQGLLFDAWRAKFDKATTDLAAAYKVLGGVNLNDTETVLQMGLDASAAWSTANNALATLRDVMTAWQSWATVTRQVSVRNDYAILRVAAVDWHTYRDHELGGTIDYWKLTGLGIPFGLADVATYQRRVADIEAAQRAEVAAAERDRMTRMQLN